MRTINEMSEMTFRRAPGTDISKYKSDLQIFNLLMAIDGRRTVGTIAKEDFYDLADLTAKIERLLAKGLIEQVGGAVSYIDPTLIATLTAELTKLVGPVAGMLVKEEAVKLGQSVERISLSRLESLLDGLAGFIQDGKRSADFKRRMMALAGRKN
jgi:hypothetical protein